jgi:hypothetical protein
LPVFLDGRRRRDRQRLDRGGATVRRPPRIDLFVDQGMEGRTIGRAFKLSRASVIPIEKFAGAMLDAET